MSPPAQHYNNFDWKVLKLTWDLTAYNYKYYKKEIGWVGAYEQKHFNPDTFNIQLIWFEKARRLKNDWNEVRQFGVVCSYRLFTWQSACHLVTKALADSSCLCLVFWFPPICVTLIRRSMNLHCLLSLTSR